MYLCLNWYFTDIWISDSEYDDDKEIYKKFEYKKIIETEPETNKDTIIKPRNRITKKRRKEKGQNKHKTKLVTINSFIHNPETKTKIPPGYNKPNELQRRPELKSYFGSKNTKMTEVSSISIKNVSNTGENAMQGIPGTVTSFVHLGRDDEGKTGNHKRRPGSRRSLQQEYSKPLVVEYQTSTMPRQATFSSKTIADSRPSQSSQAWPVIIQNSTKSILNQQKLENIGPVQRFVHLGKPANRKQKVFERSIANFHTGRRRLKVRKRVPKVDKAYSMNREAFVKYGFKI